MKTDLDALMQANGVDALLVRGAAMQNPAMVYFTGVAHITEADLIKVRGKPPVLYYNSMERGEAARTGLKTISYSAYPGDDSEAGARYRRMLADLGVTGGRIFVYGLADSGESFTALHDLAKLLPALSIEADLNECVLRAAMATKDAAEIEHIRRMGAVTVNVVSRVADYLSSQRAKDDLLVDSDGQPVTIGLIKGKINLWLAEQDAENPEGTIFSIGHDAGVPHSAGKAEDVLKLGETIVFDIFPCQAGGGYFYDFTRTWCLGHAPDEALALYEDVRSVYDQVSAEMRTGTPCSWITRRTCELFEERGHPTILSTPNTLTGLCHSVGHGLGTYIHTRPWMRLNDPYGEVLQPGMIFTYEPGLYYPERGLGVRLEDTYLVQPTGAISPLVDFPLDLVLPVRAG